jgi:hypothetical protein
VVVLLDPFCIADHEEKAVQREIREELKAAEKLLAKVRGVNMCWDDLFGCCLFDHASGT